MNYLDVINPVRALHGQGLLSHSPELEQVALAHAKRVAMTRRIFHPGGGTEIAARGQATIQEAIASWLDSPGHRRILLGNYTKCGAAKVVSRRDGKAVWMVQFA